MRQFYANLTQLVCHPHQLLWYDSHILAHKIGEDD